MEVFWKGEIGAGEDTWLQEIFLFDGVERKYISVHAFSFVDDTHIVLGHHSVDGHYGLLGGAIEAGETVEEAIIREIKEEGNAKMLRWAPLFLLRYTKKGEATSEEWHLSGWADVELLPGDKFTDVGGDVDGREVVPIDQVATKLNWGDKVNSQIKIVLEERAKMR